VIRKMAGWTGLEPAASAVTGRRYNQLNYHPAWQTRTKGITEKAETSQVAFKLCQILWQESPFSDLFLGTKSLNIRLQLDFRAIHWKHSRQRSPTGG
jgi:hypothetical protein